VGGANSLPDIDVRLLGGVDVLVDGRRVSLGGAKPRAVFACLVVQPGDVVSTDRIVDGVWGDMAPQSVRSSLQVHLSNLRKSLAASGVGQLIETRRGGYAFTAEPEMIDVHRFERHATAAKLAFASSDLHAARTSANGARTLWRGAPLAGIADMPFAAPRVTALEDQWSALIELAADIEIALGRPADVVADLERLVTEHPYREPAWARLAIALYRSGRQVDALARLRTLRHLLAEDLGLDPSVDIASLELAILNQDSALVGGPRAADSERAVHRPPQLSTIDSRLPALRPLVGREQLVASIVTTLESRRLVTLVGPGGVGKTSVAVTCAARLAADSPVTTRFVDLTSSDSADSILPGILGALGVRSDDPEVAEDHLVAVIDEMIEPLLVVDNCEHLIEEVATLTARLLTRCTRLRVLATSRQPLAVDDEVVMACPPLDRQSAVDLFVARAHAAHRSYVVTDDELAAIDQLVDCLDRLPLAIELFAARVVALSAAEMLVRLDDRAVLSASRRDSTKRHRSMSELVEWSYHLLDDEEQRCLRQLSVFGGSASWDAVLAVCEPASTATVENLVARSLVDAEHAATGTRYRLLAPVRAFAGQLLHDLGEVDAAQRRLLDHVLGWTDSIRPRFERRDPSPAVEELEADVPNVRAARRVAARLDAGEMDIEARLLAGFGRYALGFTQALPEASEWIEAALRSSRIADEVRLELLLISARFGSVDEVEREAAVAEATELASRLGDEGALALACVIDADNRLGAGVPDGLAVAERAVALSASARQPLALARALFIATTGLMRMRRFEEAEAMLDVHGLSGTERFGGLEGFVLFQRGRLAMLRGDLDLAVEGFRSAESSALRTRSLSALGLAWFGLAEVYRRRGDCPLALAYYRRVAEVDVFVEPADVSFDRTMVIWMAAELGDVELACEQFEMLQSARGVGENCMAIAAAQLAAAKGLRALAVDRFRIAIGLWSAARAWDVVADLVDCLARLEPGGLEAEKLVDAAAALRRGDLSIESIQSLVGANSS
jgi:predicted ATPase/DNA-binding SARP family transcriptional activator